MRCYICDRVIDEPQFNAEYDAYEPCETCLLAIQELVNGYDEDIYTELDDDAAYIPLTLHESWPQNKHYLDEEY